MEKEGFKFQPFSDKQLKVLTWWTDKSPVKECDGIIADGAIRSGKSISMGLSFVIWAMSSFNQCTFGLCGKTIGTFRRNVLRDLKRTAISRGYEIKENRTENYIEIKIGNVSNEFYIFGGKDERSQDLIQGITLAGVFFDEVALMPITFINQATGRCSVDGSKFWFNCNPKYPAHDFYTKWILKAKDKNIIYLHFTMDDNLSLTDKIKQRYANNYTGIFYQRNILGLWVNAEGAVYSCFDEKTHVVDTVDRPYTEYQVSIDYGTYNPFVATLWGKCDSVWYSIKEYYYCGRDKGAQKDDTQYYDDLVEFIGKRDIKQIIVDPSASSFIAYVRGKGVYKIKKAKNDVNQGIQATTVCLNTGLIKFNSCCRETISEFGKYRWNEQSQIDIPIKEHDHCMDEIRYFCLTNKLTRTERWSLLD
jgi:PBSX family phage terminase large subunit